MKRFLTLAILILTVFAVVSCTPAAEESAESSVKALKITFVPFPATPRQFLSL